MHVRGGQGLAGAEAHLQEGLCSRYALTSDQGVAEAGQIADDHLHPIHAA